MTRILVWASVGSSGILADSAAYVAAAFGLIGSFIGGAVTGYVTIKAAREAQLAAEKSWVRDTRREIYDRFLTRAQDLQSTCEHYVTGDARSSQAMERAFNEFFQVYAVVQTVAETPLVKAARVHGYRLRELHAQCVGKGAQLHPPDPAQVSEFVREARHGTVAAMRDELGLSEVARAPDNFNAFIGTTFEGRHASRRPPGPVSQ